MQTLVAELPLGNLHHLKRVRKPADGQECEVILAPSPVEARNAGGSSLLEHLPPATAQLLQALNASINIVRVPKVAPDNRGQWEEWCSIWPMPWKVPTGVQEQDGETVPAAEQVYFEQFMHLVLQRAFSQPHGSCNAAVIVDPKRQAIMGLGLPRQQVHPLSHAVMDAVEAVAAADRQQWPEIDFPHAGRRRSSDGSDNPLHQQPPAAHGQVQGVAAAGSMAAVPAAGGHHKHHLSDLQATNDAACSSSPKRPRLLEGTEQHQQQRQQREEEAPAAAAAAGQPLASAFSAPSTQPPAASKPYVCTGYDCFVLQEPCSMCAMALVHSRVGRVIYCYSSNSHGALGGLYRLQAKRSLNHHYKVYHLPLKEEAAGQQQPAAQQLGQQEQLKGGSSQRS
jgi:tRNA-specific adenosine deaminase 3